MSALVGGTTDVDAVTLSMAQMSRGETGLSDEVATRAIVLAAIVNTVFKGGIVMATGSRALSRQLLPVLGFLVAAAGVALVAGVSGTSARDLCPGWSGRRPARCWLAGLLT